MWLLNSYAMFLINKKHISSLQFNPMNNYWGPLILMCVRCTSVNKNQSLSLKSSQFIHPWSRNRERDWKATPDITGEECYSAVWIKDYEPGDEGSRKDHFKEENTFDQRLEGWTELH